MSSISKVGSIAESVRHKVAKAKNEIEHLVKSKYIDFKYYLKDVKNEVKEKMGYDAGVMESLKQSSNYAMDHGKVTYKYVSSMAEEEYRHATYQLVQQYNHQNDEL